MVSFAAAVDQTMALKLRVHGADGGSGHRCEAAGASPGSSELNDQLLNLEGSLLACR
jgi:hypothetical protein